MGTIRISETFISLQGESTCAGLTCYFVRVAGCNLRCRYCDTQYAWEGGRDVEVAAVVREAKAARTALVEITGGEPLLQPGFVELATLLREQVEGPILVETNGSQDLSMVPQGVKAVMDVKTPGSGHAESTDLKNLKRLRPDDELKFVLCDRRDYEWARDFVRTHRLEARGAGVLFSPAWGCVEGQDLARWMLADRLRVRLQIQLHKILGMV